MEATMPPALSPRRRLARLLAAAAALLTVVPACGGGGGSGAAGGAAGGTPGASRAASPTRRVSQTTARPPAIVAVTRRGALVLLSSATGAPLRTLVPGGVAGGEISASPDGRLIYYSRRHRCVDDVYSVPASGGHPVLITTGSLPAVSPDGQSLAVAREPALSAHCPAPSGDLSAQYSLVVRTLSSGVERVYPMLPPGQSAGLPAPISHLSWSADGARLAVSIAAIQDNEGWQIILVDRAAAQGYLAGGGDTAVPVTGPQPRRSYWREGVFLPDGDLFVSRACCAGIPVRNVSKLMWVVHPSGRLRHEVAIGFPGLDHTSLAASRSGRWLLYLAGTVLYVSYRQARPRQFSTGLIAAAWR
jgi:WD40-like Beta Propeller Repeat